MILCYVMSIDTLTLTDAWHILRFEKNGHAYVIQKISATLKIVCLMCKLILHSGMIYEKSVEIITLQNNFFIL